MHNPDITIGMEPDDFMSEKALRCLDQDNNEFPRQALMKCVQPMTGRYLTVRERQDRFQPKGCLSVCDINIYVNGELRQKGLFFKLLFLHES